MQSTVSFVQKITGNIDILMISESKLDNSFPDGQFLIERDIASLTELTVTVMEEV